MTLIIHPSSRTRILAIWSTTTPLVQLRRWMMIRAYWVSHLQLPHLLGATRTKGTDWNDEATQRVVVVASTAKDAASRYQDPYWDRCSFLVANIQGSSVKRLGQHAGIAWRRAWSVNTQRFLKSYIKYEFYLITDYYRELLPTREKPQHQIPLFSLQDMRFFQHFLLSCFPHHPLGNESIWTHEIPCLSQTVRATMKPSYGADGWYWQSFDNSTNISCMRSWVLRHQTLWHKIPV